MSKEYYCTEIQKIFAKACADSLVHSFGHVLAARPEFRADQIEAVAELHAVACVKMMKAFAPTAEPELVFPFGMSPDERSAWLSGEADQWRAIADRSRVRAMLAQAVEEGRFSNLQEAYRHFETERHQPPLAQASDGEVPDEESPEALLHPTSSHELL